MTTQNHPLLKQDPWLIECFMKPAAATGVPKSFAATLYAGVRFGTWMAKGQAKVTQSKNWRIWNRHVSEFRLSLMIGGSGK